MIFAEKTQQSTMVTTQESNTPSKKPRLETIANPEKQSDGDNNKKEDSLKDLNEMKDNTVEMTEVKEATQTTDRKDGTDAANSADNAEDAMAMETMETIEFVEFVDQADQAIPPSPIRKRFHRSPWEKAFSNYKSQNNDSSIYADAESTVKYSKMASTSFPRIGKPAPAFRGQAVVDGQFKEISLSDYLGKYVVLFFYPLDFDAQAKFAEFNTQLIAASNDSHFSHLAWVKTSRKEGGLGDMNIPLLADKSGSIAKNYGVYIEEEGISFRGLFIIDKRGLLRQITINDLPVGRSVDETLRLIQAFQFTDEHGEVCPANWRPGSKTIKPSVDKSKDYFENSA